MKIYIRRSYVGTNKTIAWLSIYNFLSILPYYRELKLCCRELILFYDFLLLAHSFILGGFESWFESKKR